MNNNKFFAALLSLGVAMIGFTSCSDDNDGPVGPIDSDHVAEVFPAGLPKSVDGADIKTDAQGRVTEILSVYQEGSYNETTKVVFDYSPVSRANYDMTMSLYDNDELDAIFYIQLNEDGYIKHALEVYADDEDNDEDTWDFEYNADGQLKSMIRSEGNEVTTITYTDGNITKVATLDRDDKSVDETIILYVNDDVKTPIANKGGIMLFDDCFDIDMDEMDVAYYAGLLGKATKSLPLRNESLEEMYPGQTYIYFNNFTWTLNANGLPTSMVGKNSYEDVDNVHFTW